VRVPVRCAVSQPIRESICAQVASAASDIISYRYIMSQLSSIFVQHSALLYSTLSFVRFLRKAVRVLSQFKLLPYILLFSGSIKSNGSQQYTAKVTYPS
jgi:hypothetical protein